jgi:hypothetical protein
MLHDAGRVASVFLDFNPGLTIGFDGSSCSNRDVHPKLGQTGEATELRIAGPTQEVPLPGPFISATPDHS